MSHDGRHGPDERSRESHDLTMSNLVRFFRRLLSTSMSRSTPPFERPLKRQKLAHLTPDSFKNGLFLAPMVRSGARMPTLPVL